MAPVPSAHDKGPPRHRPAAPRAPRAGRGPPQAAIHQWQRAADGHLLAQVRRRARAQRLRRAGRIHRHHHHPRASLCRRGPGGQGRARRHQRGAGAGDAVRSAGRGRHPGVLHAAHQGRRFPHRRVGAGEPLRAEGGRVSRGLDAREAARRARGHDPKRRAPVPPRVERVHLRPAGVALAGEESRAGLSGDPGPRLLRRPRARHGRQPDRSLLLVRRGKPARLSGRSLPDGEHPDPRVRPQHPPARHGQRGPDVRCAREGRLRCRHAGGIVEGQRLPRETPRGFPRGRSLPFPA